MRRLLGHSCGITAIGNDLFVNRFENEVKSNTSISIAVDKFWSDLLFGGKSRLSSVYQYENSNFLDELRNKLILLKPDKKNSFVKSFPYPANKNELEKQTNEQHFCSLDSYKYKDKDLYVATFCSRAIYMSTNDVDPSFLSDTGKNLKKDTEAQFYYRKKDVVQCYNVVILDYSKNSIILSADMSTLPKTESSLQIDRLKTKIKSIGVNLSQPSNQLSSIEPLYKNNDGRISAISFMTSDGNNSDFKLKPSQDCLRNDLYHKSGEDAVAKLAKYRLGKIWDVSLPKELKNSIELSLVGKRTMLDTGEPLSQVITSNSTSLEHTLFLLDKLYEAGNTI